MNPLLAIHGFGIYLPETRSIKDLIKEAGGDPSLWTGWDRVAVAKELDHPSTMGTIALKEALTNANIKPNEIKLVISTSVTRDYSTSILSAEIMQNLGISGSSLGFHISLGCLSTFPALEIAGPWLSGLGGGYAVIVGAERWALTEDRRGIPHPTWGLSDGAAAMVVGINTSSKVLAEYHGACFESGTQFNNATRMIYGGTRFPEIPSLEKYPYAYRADPEIDRKTMTQAYVGATRKVCADVKARFKFEPDWLVCNQGSLELVTAYPILTGISKERVCMTGNESGHVGSNDVIIGLKKLYDQGNLHGNILMSGSYPGAWGAAMLKAA